MAGTPEAVLVQQDLNLLPLLNLVAEPVAGSVVPSAANVGKLYRNTVSGRLEYVRTSAIVVSIPWSGGIVDADIAAGAAIALNKLATDPLARTNHTGTQLAVTISDLAAIVKAYRLDEFAAPTATVSLGSQRLANVADPVSPQDAATNQWVTNLVTAAANNRDWKDSVKVASTVNVNLAAPGANIDGVAMSAGERFLAAVQTTASQSGVYIWNGPAAAATRSLDADVNLEVTSGLTVPVEQGTQQDKLAILATDGAITLGTTGLSWVFIGNGQTYTAGAGITIAGGVISITAPVSLALGGTGATDAAGARANLGAPRAGLPFTLGAIAAGGTIDVAHGLNTLDVALQVYRLSDGATVRIGTQRLDANTARISSDVVVAISTLRLLVTPLA